MGHLKSVNCACSWFFCILVCYSYLVVVTNVMSLSTCFSFPTLFSIPSSVCHSSDIYYYLLDQTRKKKGKMKTTSGLDRGRREGKLRENFYILGRVGFLLALGMCK